jgi:hypothetical protein
MISTAIYSCLIKLFIQTGCGSSHENTNKTKKKANLQ